MPTIVIDGDHQSDGSSFEEIDGWFNAKCSCGWELGPLPGTEEVTDSLMMHAYAMGAENPSKARLAKLFHQVWTEVHVWRYAKRDGKAGGPDDFYNGVVNSALNVLRMARKHSLSEQDVYHPEQVQ